MLNEVHTYAQSSMVCEGTSHADSYVEHESAVCTMKSVFCTQNIFLDYHYDCSVRELTSIADD